MKADLLRENFLGFFKSKRHKIIESDSLVPKDDPTVLFTPAGMNQFKKEFLGQDCGFKRAATSQRCLRTDDLEKVGKTPAHHTFFEMLGNFSFGDYFKDEAIAWAWEFLTEVLKIEKARLWVSVYKEDGEAYLIWKDKIKVLPEKILKLGDKDNFWPAEAKEKGPNGPCGPCSEIFFDFGEGAGCGKPDCSPACDCGRFSEVWNLVFTQFNRKEGGVLEPLPQRNIDTGMGLERLAAVMQGVNNNFETDLFAPVIEEIASCVLRRASCEKEYIYAVADHIRAVIFAIYDGVLPSNEGRGYVIRKIIRKSVLHLQALGIKKPFLYKLVPVVAEIMKIPYPDLLKRRENIAQIILAEEKSFIATLDTSDKLLGETFDKFVDKYQIVKDSDTEQLNSLSATAGAEAFRLYDTYGIPLELTKSWLYKRNTRVYDTPFQLSFDKGLNKQKELSKSLSAMKGDVFGGEDLGLKVKESKFVGYDNFEAKAKILSILRGSAGGGSALGGSTPVKKVAKGEEAKVVLDKTTFYAESGGQVGDSGEIIKGKNVFEVLDTQRVGKVTVHIGKVKEGNFKNSDLVAARVNAQRRLSIARNHTATHLLQAALRQVLGEHVKQQGSLVAEDRLRFDFTHFKGLDKEQLERIEELVNNYIIDNYALTARQMALAQAKKSGALAFFQEKYQDKVRVVAMGDFSKELCGGTHLDSTGQIGLFKIIQEGSVASGVRRIEAATGAFAYKLVKDEEGVLDDISALLNTRKENIPQTIKIQLERIKVLEKQLQAQKMDSAKNSLDALIQNAEVIKGVKVITGILEGLNMDLLRKNMDLLKQKTANTVIALGSGSQGRAILVVGVTSDLCDRLDAGQLIRDIAQEIGGSGGGRKDFAQAGGSKPENLEKVFQKLKENINNMP
jgi:alanyl-tRNA synthetase